MMSWSRTTRAAAALRGAMMKAVNVWVLNWAARANSAFWCVVTCTSIRSGLVSSTLLVSSFRSLGDHDLSSSLQQAPSQFGKAAELTYVVLIVCIDSDPRD